MIGDTMGTAISNTSHTTDGIRRSIEWENSTRSCYLGVFPTPSLDHTLHDASWTTILLKFDLVSPYPSFVPYLSLRVPGDQCSHDCAIYTVHVGCFRNNNYTVNRE